MHWMVVSVSAVVLLVAVLSATSSMSLSGINDSTGDDDDSILSRALPATALTKSS